MRIFLASLCVFFVACGLDDSVSDFNMSGDAASSSTDASISDASIKDATVILEDGRVVTNVDGYEKPITFDPSKVQSDLTDFPAWVDLTSADLTAHATSDAHDVFFTASDGTPIAYEIQGWSLATGHLSAWVKVSLSKTTATLIYVRYGGTTAAPAPSSKAVFSSSFVAVWHLENPPDAVSFNDALGLHVGTAVNLSSTPTVAAKLGGGVAFDGGTGQITFSNPLSGKVAHTISVWVSQGATTDNDALVVLGNGATDQSRWLHSAYANPAVNPTTLAIGFYGDDWTNPNINIQGAGWTLLNWVFDGNTANTIYRDGASVATDANPNGNSANTQGDAGYLGNAPAAWGVNMGAHAIMDEVRIATVARSPAWIAAEFANQSAASTFYAVGSEQAAP